MIWRALYATLLVFCYPFVVLWLILRGGRDSARRGSRRERLGWVYASVPRDVIWVHAVSAGEAATAAPLIRELIAKLPDVRVLVTTVNPTAASHVRRLLGNRVSHCYAPYDFPWALRRFLNRVRPRLLVLFQTELWPNRVRMSAERHIPVVLINARLSERSARRFRRVGAYTRETLQRLTWIGAQYAEDAQRFVELGAEPAVVDVAGDVNFDVEMPGDFDDRVAALKARWETADRPVWIAAGTHVNEDEVVFDAHRALLKKDPRALLILVPRHPERYEQALEHAGEPLIMQRMASATGATAQVIVGDTMGQLIYLYGVATVAFVGGSLAAGGAVQNPIEAAAAGLPLLIGPHEFKYDKVVAAFETGGCLHRVTDATNLAEAVAGLFEDSARRAVEAARAKQVVATYAGAAARIAERLAERLA
ncbi:MAG TPA: 3-deoxy-D-manno-octulosonic acid transferase [Pseudomonadales bacterium]